MSERKFCEKCTIAAKGLTHLLWSWGKKVVNARISHLKARAHEVKAPLRLEWPNILHFYGFCLQVLLLAKSNAHSKSDISLGPGGCMYQIDLVKEGSFASMDWLRIKLWIRNRALLPAAQNVSKVCLLLLLFTDFPEESRSMKGCRKEMRPKGFLLSVKPSSSKETAQFLNGVYNKGTY